MKNLNFFFLCKSAFKKIIQQRDVNFVHVLWYKK